MDCKLPAISRSYKVCVSCNNRYRCKDSTTNIPQIPDAKPLKKNKDNQIGIQREESYGKS